MKVKEFVTYKKSRYLVSSLARAVGMSLKAPYTLNTEVEGIDVRGFEAISSSHSGRISKYDLTRP